MNSQLPNGTLANAATDRPDCRNSSIKVTISPKSRRFRDLLFDTPAPSHSSGLCQHGVAERLLKRERLAHAPLPAGAHVDHRVEG
jgi:hypothetical protein